MTPAEWLSSSEPEAMLRELGVGLMFQGKPLLREGVTDRKLRLFACACCLMRGSRVEEVNKYEADGFHYEELIYTDLEWARAWVARELGRLGHPKPPTFAQRANLLREIVGNPWKPVTIPHSSRTRHEDGTITYEGCGWLTSTVLRLATAIYEGRDWSAMPVLADALEESGCHEEAILRHLRGEEERGFTETCQSCGGDGIAASSSTYEGRPCRRCDGKGTRTFVDWRSLRSPHVRGCWAIDLILGRE